MKIQYTCCIFKCFSVVKKKLFIFVFKKGYFINLVTVSKTTKLLNPCLLEFKFYEKETLVRSSQVVTRGVCVRGGVFGQ